MFFFLNNLKFFCIIWRGGGLFNQIKVRLKRYIETFNHFKIVCFLYYEKISVNSNSMDRDSIEFRAQCELEEVGWRRCG